MGSLLVVPDVCFSHIFQGWLNHQPSLVLWGRVSIIINQGFSIQAQHAYDHHRSRLKYTPFFAYDQFLGNLECQTQIGRHWLVNQEATHLVPCRDWLPALAGSQWDPQP